MTADSASTQPNGLLEEGGRSYLKAMLALSQFRGMVQDACIAAMRRSLPGLGAALGLPLEFRQVKPYAWPDKLGSGAIDGTWASLAARLKEPGGARCNLWNLILWRDVRPTLSVVVAIDFLDLDIGERAWATVRDHGTWKYEEETDPPEIQLLRSINADGLASLGSTLDGMNHEWMQGWQKVGGVKQFLRKR
jgi:hypothetical protein